MASLETQSPIYGVLSEIIKIETQQSIDEGKDVSSLENENDSTITFGNNFNHAEEQLRHILEKFRDLPNQKHYPFVEPNDWHDILIAAECSEKTCYKQRNKIPKEIIKDKIHGGILGKCIGCLLGKPIEGWSREKINSFLRTTNNYPLRKYLFDDLEDVQCKQYDLPTHWTLPLQGMPEDDDVNYLVLAFHIIKEYGLDFTSRQVAEIWMKRLPMMSVHTAERIAYRNMSNGILPPLSASYCNPYREWIGAQIRADFFGYICPENPLLAMNLAWKDASISHVKNGIYGAMWVAALIANSSEGKSFELLIEETMRLLPRKSRFYSCMSEVLHWYKAKLTLEKVLENVHLQFCEKQIHHWCHVLPNAMIVAIALLWGTSFVSSLEIAISAGFDTDCNAATVGSIWGYAFGAKSLPSYWVDALQDRIHTSIIGATEVRISQLADEAYVL